MWADFPPRGLTSGGLFTGGGAGIRPPPGTPGPGVFPGLRTLCFPGDPHSVLAFAGAVMPCGSRVLLQELQRPVLRVTHSNKHSLQCSLETQTCPLDFKEFARVFPASHPLSYKILKGRVWICGLFSPPVTSHTLRRPGSEWCPLASPRGMGAACCLPAGLLSSCRSCSWAQHPRYVAQPGWLSG